MEQEEAAVEAVAVKGDAGNDLPPGFSIDDFPSQKHPFPIQLVNHRPVAWILKFVIDIVANEVDE